ncbi:hypothetical protein BCR42DRAFT_405628 [Absidia repens]|uniref:Uncharacterized protein n=1 Tax=Absidia repens TaxID=90262 RepID=A0A1X2ITS0_9FUNG|nr:hypothetical protein BCR42DRAFT_405628 [Absidia repens]
MSKNTIPSSTVDHQVISDISTNPDTNSELPPPYSQTPQQPQHSIPSSSTNSQQDNLPNDNPAYTIDAQPSAPLLYPEIPQQLSPGHNIAFPVPQPYNNPSQKKQQLQIPNYNANVSTPLYFHAHQQQHSNGQHGILYGSTHHQHHHHHQHHSAHGPPSSPPPPPRFHPIYIPGHQPAPPPQHYRFAPPTDSVRRSFPVGALIFIIGWAFPPLWILGACCCAASRNPYEAWWARLNLTMALLLLVSSIIYSMLAILAGDWYVGLQWISLRQEI